MRNVSLALDGDAAGAGLVPLRWADAAVVVVDARDVESLALDGADRRWDRRRRLRADAAGTDRRWSGGRQGGTGAAWAGCGRWGQT